MSASLITLVAIPSVLEVFPFFRRPMALVIYPQLGLPQFKISVPSAGICGTSDGVWRLKSS